MVRISEQESKVFGLRIGRYSGNMVDLDTNRLVKDVLLHGVDLCRLKILGSDLKLFDKLEATNFHYEIYNLSYYNRFNFDSMKSTAPHPKLSAREVVDPGNDKDFRLVLSRLLASRSWVEYDSFLSKHLLTEEAKREASFDFYSSFSRSNQGDSYTGLMYFEDKPIGLFMGIFKKDVFFGNLFGLIEEYRGKGLSKYFYGFMFDICQAKGIRYFENEVNIFNFSSQQSAVSQNFTPQEIYYNITLFPFCNLEERAFKELPFTDLPALLKYISESYEQFDIGSIKTRRYSQTQRYEYALVSEVIHTANRAFVVVHFMFDSRIGKSIYVYLTMK